MAKLGTWHRFPTANVIVVIAFSIPLPWLAHHVSTGGKSCLSLLSCATFAILRKASSDFQKALARACEGSLFVGDPLGDPNDVDSHQLRSKWIGMFTLPSWLH